MHLIIPALCALACLPWVNGADPRWLDPNGSEEDFTEFYVLDSLAQISWQGLNNSISDLWLTSYDVNVNSFAQKIATAIDITNPGSYSWNVSVNATQVNNDNHFMFRFVPTGVVYDQALAEQKASPGFVLRLAKLSATVTATVTATSNAIPTYTAATSSSTTGNGLSTGATIGIIIAATLGLLTCIAAGCLLGMRIEKRKMQKHGTATLVDGQLGSSSSVAMVEKEGPRSYELSGSILQPAELESPVIGTSPTSVRSAL